MLYLDLLCASVSKMCPKVIASSLYAISAYESFHRTALLSDSRGNLYLEHYQVLNKYEHLAYTPPQSHGHTYTPHTMHPSGTRTCYQSRCTQGTHSPGHHSIQPGRPGQDHATHTPSKTPSLGGPMERPHGGSFQECLNPQRQSWSQPALCRGGGAGWPQTQKCFSPLNEDSFKTLAKQLPPRLPGSPSSAASVISTTLREFSFLPLHSSDANLSP